MVGREGPWLLASCRPCEGRDNETGGLWRDAGFGINLDGIKVGCRDQEAMMWQDHIMRDTSFSKDVEISLLLDRPTQQVSFARLFESQVAKRWKLVIAVKLSSRAM